MGLIIDCFAGGGGASTGIEMALGRDVNIAVNHDPEAIRMHKVNHPRTIHLTEDIFTVDLLKYVGGEKVDLMWASPDCTSHSKAKGGQPRKNGLRILPWAVYKHAQTLLPDVIIMENVEEIQQWGPLDSEGYPIKERAGEDYDHFITSMKSLGYVFQSKELVAADYGAPTTRKRWYAVFRRDGKPIVFPAPTRQKKDWERCADYIDWSDLGKSIFDRPKPLADKTMQRIANGFRKFVVDNPKPYIVPNKEAYSYIIQYHSEQTSGDCRGQLLTEPIKTIDTSNRYGLVTAFVTKFYKTGVGQECTEPLHTITTSQGHFGLISAFLVKYYGCGNEKGLLRPVDTITTKDRFGLVSCVVEINGEKYILQDIFLRMLKPQELKRLQGFPDDYIIDHDIEGKPYPAKEQVARIGNSVVPIMAKELVLANCSYLKTENKEKEKTEMELRVNEVQLPAQITFNYEELKAELTERVHIYETMVYTDDQIKAAKDDRANLNKLKKALNDERIRREKEYMVPFNTFKAQITELCGIIDKAAAAVDTQVKSFEDNQKREKQAKIMEIKAKIEEDNASDLQGIVLPFDDKWLNASTSIKSIEEALKGYVTKITTDLATLQNLPEFGFEAVEVYKSTLDINRAIGEAQRMSAIAKAKAEREAEMARRAEEEAARKQAEAEAAAQAKAESDEFPAEEEPAEEKPQPARAWIKFQALMTVDDALALKAFLNSRNIEYKAI